ncbi:MAG: glycosyltransferase family 87 protein [Planctomycetota bacterium]
MTTSTTKPPRWAMWVWSALAIFLVLRAGGRERGVITDHREFGRRLVAGEELYAPHLEAKPLHPVYPPSYGLMTAPFALLGDRPARYAWAAAQVLALWVILRAFLRALERHAPQLAASPAARHGVLLLTVLALGRYLLRDTHGGGGNLLNLAMAIAAYEAAERGRLAKSAWWFGFSLATKPTMALLAPVLVVLGHGRAVLAAAGVACALMTSALLWHGHGLAPLQRWVEGSLAYATQTDLFAEPHLGFPPFTWMNQSLRCMVARYFGEVPPHFAEQVPGFLSGLGWSSTVTASITRALGLLILGATMAVAWRSRAVRTARELSIAAALAAGVLLSPISWKAHHVALLPAVFALCAAAWQKRRFARAGLLAFVLLCTAGGGDLIGSAGKEWQQSSYVAVFAAIGLWAMTLAAAVAPARDRR